MSCFFSSAFGGEKYENVYMKDLKRKNELNVPEKALDFIMEPF